jgi:GTPase SAR1 family protein
MASAKQHPDSDPDDEVINLQFKIILLGDGAVGKTSIATRFSENNFSQHYKQTVGVDFFMKRISLSGKYLLVFINNLWSISIPTLFATYLRFSLHIIR